MSAASLMTRAMANGYAHGAHHNEDNSKPKKKYGKKALKDQT